MTSQPEVVTLLLVEDDDVAAEAVVRALATRRILNPVVIVTSAVDALAVLRGEHATLSISRPYMVLLDLNLPRMSGHEFLDRLRADPVLSSTVVFVLTTSEDEQDKARAYSKHVAGYLVKSRVGEDLRNLTGLLDHYWQIVALPDAPRIGVV